MSGEKSSIWYEEDIYNCVGAISMHLLIAGGRGGVGGEAGSRRRSQRDIADKYLGRV